MDTYRIETGYRHEIHIKRQKIIHALQDKIKLYLECPYYHRYFEYVRINKCIIIEYDDFKKILKKDTNLWCILSHDIHMDLRDITDLMIY